MFRAYKFDNQMLIYFNALKSMVYLKMQVILEKCNMFLTTFNINIFL